MHQSSMTNSHSQTRENTRLNIVYLAPFDLRIPAGHTTHALATVKELARNGHDVTLLSIGCPGLEGQAVRFVQIPVISRSGFLSFSFGAASAKALRREIIRSRPDAIYTRYFTAVYFPIFLAWRRRVPVVVEVNSDLANERYVTGRGRLAVLLERFEERAVFRIASKIVAVSTAIGSSITELVPMRKACIHQIANGVDMSIYSPRDRTESAIRLNLDVNRRRIIFTGAFQVWQGVLDLVTAISILSKEGRDIELLLVGDGPQRDEIDQAVERFGLQEIVRFTGYVSESLVADYICASDVCVAPYNTQAASYAETEKTRYGAQLRGSPLKLFTYLACGVPVVATHFCEAGVYVSERGAGLAVEPEQPQSLVDAISRILDDPDLAWSMGKRARRLAEESHDWSQSVDAYIEVIRSVVHSS
jgi:glycosyltransferase involved in cell wall biosynthesis